MVHELMKNDFSQEKVKPLVIFCGSSAVAVTAKFPSDLVGKPDVRFSAMRLI